MCQVVFNRHDNVPNGCRILAAEGSEILHEVRAPATPAEVFCRGSNPGSGVSQDILCFHRSVGSRVPREGDVRHITQTETGVGQYSADCLPRKLRRVFDPVPESFFSNSRNQFAIDHQASG
jgi:hypothetical protein